MSLSAATAAPSPVSIADKTYTASPVGLAGLGELEEHARARVFENAHKVQGKLPPALREAFMERATKLAIAIDFDTGEFHKYLMSQRGMETLLWISIRPRHPGVTPEEVAKIVKDHEAELVLAVQTILRISGYGESGKGEKGGPPSGEEERGGLKGSSEGSSSNTDFSPAMSAA